MTKNKLIVIRGNSGCGKSTVTKMLLEKFPDRKIAYIEQDHVRRNILREKGSVKGVHNKMLEELVKFSLKNKYDVILEVILSMKLYSHMLKRISKLTKDVHFFYFNIPYEETLKRHKTKKLAKEISEDKHRSWYIENDRTKFKSEKILTKDMSMVQVTNYIIKETGLK